MENDPSQYIVGDINLLSHNLFITLSTVLDGDISDSVVADFVFMRDASNLISLGIKRMSEHKPYTEFALQTRKGDLESFLGMWGSVLICQSNKCLVSIIFSRMFRAVN